MSTCPNFDLYSVYLDQEMSESITQAFSKHLEECTECKSNFSRLRSLHTALCSDSQSLSYSKTKMDESFNKLCVVMNYKAVTKKAQPNQIIKTLKILSPALAAAMVFALIIPLRLLRNTEIPQILPPQITTGASLISSRGIIVDNTLSSILANSQNLQKISSLDFTNTNISSIDVFKPVLSNDSITIQIKLTGIHEMLPYASSGLYDYNSNFNEASFAAMSGAQF